MTTAKKKAANVKVAEKTNKPKQATVTVEVPVENNIPESCHRPERVDTGRLSQLQRENLKRVCFGLEKTGAKLKDGTNVTTAGHAVRWILEGLT